MIYDEHDFNMDWVKSVKEAEFVAELENSGKKAKALNYFPELQGKERTAKIKEVYKFLTSSEKPEPEVIAASQG